MTEKKEMHSGVIHEGLRYVLVLRGIAPDADVRAMRRCDLRREGEYDAAGPFYIARQRPQSRWRRLFGYRTRSLTELCETSIAKVREYDAVVETFNP